LAAGAVSAADADGLSVYDLRDSRRVTLAALIPELLQRRIVIVGEQHTDENHHRAQLRSSKPCRKREQGGRRPRNVSAGQPRRPRPLDGRRHQPAGVRTIYYDNWNYPWPAYRPIFEYARTQKIPMIGLNVARRSPPSGPGGFQSLSEEQRGQLSDVACNIG